MCVCVRVCVCVCGGGDVEVLPSVRILGEQVIRGRQIRHRFGKALWIVSCWREGRWIYLPSACWAGWYSLRRRALCVCCDVFACWGWELHRCV